jgi:dihydropyrimidinase
MAESTHTSDEVDLPDRLELVVRGGEAWIDGELVRTSVGVREGRIVAIAPNLPQGDREIDATGLLVLPGGIDVHTHFDTEVGHQHTADDYASGTRAAAYGGLTTFVNYALQEHGERIRDVVLREQRNAASQSRLDYSFHVLITDPSVEHFADDLRDLPALGCPSVKVFTTGGFRLSDDDLLRVLAIAAENGLMVNVHAEDGPLIDYLAAVADAEGRHDVGQLGAISTPQAEALAVEKMTTYAAATGASLYIVHLSSALALKAAERARARGQAVYVETRPAYLFLDDSSYLLPDERGKLYTCSPPLRPKSDQNALWQGLASGAIDSYATDHTTWTVAEKMQEGLRPEEIPAGISNVETSLGMLYSEGVHTGRLPLARFVAVTSETPARLFGMWPRKGAIRVGSDADLALIDPEREFSVVSAAMQSASDFDPYDGYVSHGWPVITLSRGDIVAGPGESASDGRGRFIHRRPHDIA